MTPLIDSLTDTHEPLKNEIGDAPGWRPPGRGEPVFEAQYEALVSRYAAESPADLLRKAGSYADQEVMQRLVGRAVRTYAIKQLHDDHKTLANKFVRLMLSEGYLDAWIAHNPVGAGEAKVRPLTARSFGLESAFNWTPAHTGKRPLIPRADDVERVVAVPHQAWLILGWVEMLDSSRVPYKRLWETVDDPFGERDPVDLVFDMDGQRALKVTERKQGPLPLPPGSEYRADVDIHKTHINMELRPIGIEVIVAASARY